MAKQLSDELGNTLLLKREDLQKVCTSPFGVPADCRHNDCQEGLTALTLTLGNPPVHCIRQMCSLLEHQMQYMVTMCSYGVMLLSGVFLQGAWCFQQAGAAQPGGAGSRGHLCISWQSCSRSGASCTHTGVYPPPLTLYISISENSMVLSGTFVSFYHSLIQ